MAEATQATTTATETLTAAATDASALPATGATDATATPDKGETIVVGTKQPGALERAAAALEKHDAASKGKPADDANPEAATKAEGEADKSEDKPKEEDKPGSEKKEEPRLAKGLALLAEREERARGVETRAKNAAISAATVVREAEAKAAGILAELGPDVTLVRAVRDLVAKGDQVGALEAMGITLARAIDLMSRKIEPSAEDIQRKIVREEFEARDAARKEADAKDAAAKAERDRVSETVQQEEFIGKVFALNAADYPFSVHRKVTGEQIWGMQKHVAGELGRTPTQTEVMARIESILKADYEAAQNLLKPTASPTASPAPTAKPAESAKPKAPAKAEEKPAEQQSRKPGKRESASERAERALRQAGIS